MFRSAIVGCGPRGEQHAAAYEYASKASLVACCDRDPHRLDDFGGRFSIADRYLDLNAMMASVEPDLVHVVMPPKNRWAVIEQVLRYTPRAILLEKPLAELPEEGYRIIEGCAAAGVPLFVNHQLRFHPSARLFKELVNDNSVGSVRTVRVTAQLYNLVETGTHLFDLVSYLFDDKVAFTETFAQTEGRVGDAYLTDAPAASVGVIGSSAGWHLYFEFGDRAPAWGFSAERGRQHGIELVGESATVGYSALGSVWRTGGSPEAFSFDFRNDDPVAQAGLVDAIATSVINGTPHPNGMPAARIAFDMIMAAQRSSRHRKWVAIEEPVADAEIQELRAEQMGLAASIAGPMDVAGE